MVTWLLDETEARCNAGRDAGPARLIQFADSRLADTIACDPRKRELCMRAGERHVAVSATCENAFRRALREIGYVLPTAK